MRLNIDYLLHYGREKKLERYYEIIRKPKDQLTQRDLEDFQRLYDYFEGNLEP